MTPQELMLTLGLPSWGPAAAAAGVVRAPAFSIAINLSKIKLLFKAPMDLDGFSDTALEHAAGNGMSVPAVGFAMLVAVLALQPVAKP